MTEEAYRALMKRLENYSWRLERPTVGAMSLATVWSTAGRAFQAIAPAGDDALDAAAQRAFAADATQEGRADA